MRLRNKAFAKGLAVGLVIGLLTTLTLSATASTGRKAWDRFGDMFKSGYVAGFTDCLRIAKGFDHRGYLATVYTLPPRTKGVHWIRAINDLYEDEDHQSRDLPQMMVVAGERLAKQFGPEIQAKTSGLAGLRAFFDARRKARLEADKAKAAAEAEGSGASEAEPEADVEPQADKD